MADYIEQNCVFEHEGRTYESGGAVVTDDYVIGYIGDGGKLTNWHGDVIGFYERTARWETPRSFVSAYMSQYRITIPSPIAEDGTFDAHSMRHYTGRGAGKNMIVKARRVASERR